MVSSGKFFDGLTIRVAAGETVVDAAGAIGCSARHGYRLASSPEFARRVAELRTAATDAAVGKLSSVATEAVEVLRSIMQDTEAKSGDRVSAARAALSLLAPMAELHELRRRLDRLEAVQAAPLRITG